MPNDYHNKAQKFIKSAKSKGMTVKAEGGELIAYPKGMSAKKTFNESSGMKHAGSYATGVKSVVKKVAKTVGNIIAKPFDKAIDVAQRKDAEIERKRKSGELLY